MPVWGQLNLQEGSTITIELINYFHDYIIIFLVCEAFLFTALTLSIISVFIA